MKIGSAVIFLFVAFIALGYLLSNNMNMYEELIQIKQQNEVLSQEKLTIQAELDVLRTQNAENEKLVADLTQKDLYQRQQIQILSEENFRLNEQNTILQKQTESLKLLNSLLDSLPRELSLAIFLPLIPASMAATYIIVRYKRNYTHSKNTNAKKQRTTPVQLTDEEVKTIIRMRRTK